MSQDITQLEGFDAFIEKRKEAVGGEGNTFKIPGFGREWDIIAPDLAGPDWIDSFDALSQDIADGLITTAQHREEFCELLLGDQAEDFLAACATANDGKGINAVGLLNWALSKYREQREENPTQGRSRAIRRRAKRR